MDLLGLLVIVLLPLQEAVDGVSQVIQFGEEILDGMILEVLLWDFEWRVQFEI